MRAINVLTVSGVVLLGSLLAVACGGSDSDSAGSTAGTGGSTAGAGGDAGAGGSTAGAGGSTAGSGGSTAGAGGSTGGSGGGSAGKGGSAGGSAGKGGSAGGSAGSGGSAAGAAGAPPAKTCEPTTQTGCTDAAKPKCTLQVAGQDVLTACLAEGTKKEGEVCTRKLDASNKPVVGDDDCAKGFFCSGTGNGDFDANATPQAGPRNCRKFCASTKDCGAKTICSQLDNLEPPDGFCLPTCEPFSTGTCGKGVCADLFVDITPPANPDTDPVVVGFGCRPKGGGVEGDACMGNADCDADMVCLNLSGSGAECAKLCDDTHKCTKGTCQTDLGLAAPYDKINYCHLARCHR